MIHLQEGDDFYHDDVDKFHAEREKVSYILCVKENQLMDYLFSKSRKFTKMVVAPM